MEEALEVLDLESRIYMSYSIFGEAANAVPAMKDFALENKGGVVRKTRETQVCVTITKFDLPACCAFFVQHRSRAALRSIARFHHQMCL